VSIIRVSHENRPEANDDIKGGKMARERKGKQEEIDIDAQPI